MRRKHLHCWDELFACERAERAAVYKLHRTYCNDKVWLRYEHFDAVANDNYQQTLIIN